MEARLEADEYAKGVRALHALVTHVWPKERERPLLVAGDGNWHREWYQAVARLALPLDALTYHRYYAPGRMRELLTRMQSPLWLSRGHRGARYASLARDAAAPNLGLWVTELGSSDNSGAFGAHAFGSSLWYAACRPTSPPPSLPASPPPPPPPPPPPHAGTLMPWVPTRRWDTLSRAGRRWWVAAMLCWHGRDRGRGTRRCGLGQTFGWRCCGGG